MQRFPCVPKSTLACSEGLSMAEAHRLAAVRYPLPKALLIHLSLQSTLGQDGGPRHRQVPHSDTFPCHP